MYYNPNDSYRILNGNFEGWGSDSNLIKPLLAQVIGDLIGEIDIIMDKIQSFEQDLALNFHIIPIYLYKYFDSTLLCK